MTTSRLTAFNKVWDVVPPIGHLLFDIRAIVAGATGAKLQKPQADQTGQDLAAFYTATTGRSIDEAIAEQIQTPT